MATRITLNELKRLVKKIIKEANDSKKTYLLTHVWVDVYEDDPNEGQGKHVNSWNEKLAQTFDSKESLIKYITDSEIYADLKPTDFAYDDDYSILSVDVLVDKENVPATDSEIKKWESGQLKLYNARYEFKVEVFIKTKSTF